MIHTAVPLDAPVEAHLALLSLERRTAHQPIWKVVLVTRATIEDYRFLEGLLAANAGS